MSRKYAISWAADCFRPNDDIPLLLREDSVSSWIKKLNDLIKSEKGLEKINRVECIILLITKSGYIPPYHIPVIETEDLRYVLDVDKYFGAAAINPEKEVKVQEQLHLAVETAQRKLEEYNELLCLAMHLF